ncbi:TetR/AcrR family transcriptional regulator [Streptomyces sp. SID4956]|uniref:TetR family transcriptional regulator n=1 Tax=Streptomyces sp. SID4956 TaxID=2690290 RepID=UPI00136CB673|nr:TetR family transcriptional regulator [Streptomyces sp. SID4956]
MTSSNTPATAQTDAAASTAASGHGSHAARSRVTQQHILDSAVRVLIESGYSGASTLTIQQRAGVSRGRLLHQFPHRDALLVAAVQHIAEARVADTRGLTDWPAAPRLRVEAAVDAMWSTYHQGYFWAATELWLAARHNRHLADALAPKEHALGSAIRAAIDEMFGPGLTAHPHYPALRELLNTSMRGVALTYSFDPRDHLEEAALTTWKALAARELGLID